MKEKIRMFLELTNTTKPQGLILPQTPEDRLFQLSIEHIPRLAITKTIKNKQNSI
jgi:hypothetical protein